MRPACIARPDSRLPPRARREAAGDTQWPRGLVTLKTRADFLRVAAAAAGRRAPVLCCRRRRARRGRCRRDGAGRLYRQSQGRQRGRAQSRKAAVAGGGRRGLPRDGRPGTDYVLIARAGTGERRYADLLADLAAALRQVDAAHPAGSGSPAAPRRGGPRGRAGSRRPERVEEVRMRRDGSAAGLALLGLALRGAIRAYQLLICAGSSRPPAAITRAARTTPRKRSRCTDPGAARCWPRGGCCAVIPGAAAATTRSAEPSPRSCTPTRQMEQRNLLLAIVLSVGILIGFQFLLEKFHPVANRRRRQPDQPAPRPDRAGPERRTAPATPGAAGTAGRTGAPLRRQRRLTREQAHRRAAARADQHAAAARLDRADRRPHRRSDAGDLPRDPRPEEPRSRAALADRHEGRPISPSSAGWPARPAPSRCPARIRCWTASGGPLTPTSPVTLTWDNGAGLVFTRTISVDENYMFTVRDAVRNTGGAPVTLSPYGLISRTGTPQVGGYYILHEGLIGYLGGSLREVDYSSLDPAKPLEYTSTGGWLGFTDKYWLTALVPPQDEAIKAQLHAHASRRGRPLPGRLSRARRSRCRPTARRRLGALLRRRQGSQPARRLRRLGHPAVRPRDRFRLVLLPDQADLPDAAVLLRTARQFRPGDPAADPDHQAALLPARQQILSGDEQDEAAAAGDGRRSASASPTTRRASSRKSWRCTSGSAPTRWPAACRS